MGIRPEKPAAVYPYVTFAINFKPVCFAVNARRRGLLPGSPERAHRFNTDFTITRVSKISVKSRGKIPCLIFGLANITPLGVTVTEVGVVVSVGLPPSIPTSAGSNPAGRAKSKHPSFRGGPPPSPAIWFGVL